MLETIKSINDVDFSSSWAGDFTVQDVWSIADTFNGLMAIPNLIALFLLSGTVVKLVKEKF